MPPLGIWGHLGVWGLSGPCLRRRSAARRTQPVSAGQRQLGGLCWGRADTQPGILHQEPGENGARQPVPREMTGGEEPRGGAGPGLTSVLAAWPLGASVSSSVKGATPRSCGGGTASGGSAVRAGAWPGGLPSDPLRRQQEAASLEPPPSPHVEAGFAHAACPWPPQQRPGLPLRQRPSVSVCRGGGRLAPGGEAEMPAQGSASRVLGGSVVGPTGTRAECAGRPGCVE